MDYALGELGLLPHDFWRMTWAEYERAMSGYRTRQDREWERTRQTGEWFAAFMGVDLPKELKGKRLLKLSTDTPPPPDPNLRETPSEWRARKKAELEASHEPND